MFQRPQFELVRGRLHEPRRFIQVLLGPRQTGKTTLIHQVLETLDLPTHVASADQPATKDRSWIEQQWEAGRLLLRAEPRPSAVVLVLDEIQKVPDWSEITKRLWDEDSADRRELRVVLLGSSPWLIQKGLGESLAGRFELIRMGHWPWVEMKTAFGWGIEDYVYYGGYPGAAPLRSDPDRWRSYIQDSLIETTISRDVLLMTRVDKPALLRQLFHLGCLYSGQVLSFTKLLGQLQDAGNTTTLAHYLDLLEAAGLVGGLRKYAGQPVRRRRSSPKLQVYNTALLSAQSGFSFAEIRARPERWGRLVESCVGAHLVNACLGTDISVHYWSHRNREVDFVLARGDTLIAIEVKSGRTPTSLPGLEAFARDFPVQKSLLVGGTGVPLEVFLRMPIADLW